MSVSVYGRQGVKQRCTGIWIGSGGRNRLRYEHTRQCTQLPDRTGDCLLSTAEFAYLSFERLYSSLFDVGGGVQTDLPTFDASRASRPLTVALFQYQRQIEYDLEAAGRTHGNLSGLANFARSQGKALLRCRPLARDGAIATHHGRFQFDLALGLSGARLCAGRPLVSVGHTKVLCNLRHRISD